MIHVVIHVLRIQQTSIEFFLIWSFDGTGSLSHRSDVTLFEAKYTSFVMPLRANTQEASPCLDVVNSFLCSNHHTLCQRKSNRDTKPGLLVINVGDIVDVDLDICSFGPAGMELRAALGGKHIRIALDAAHSAQSHEILGL